MNPQQPIERAAVGRVFLRCWRHDGLAGMERLTGTLSDSAITGPAIRLVHTVHSNSYAAVPFAYLVSGDPLCAHASENANSLSTIFTKLLSQHTQIPF